VTERFWSNLFGAYI